MDLIKEYRKLGCSVTNCHNYLTDIQTWLRESKSIHIKMDINYASKDEKRTYWAELFNINLYNQTFKNFSAISMPLYGASYDKAFEKGIERALIILNNKS